MRTTDVVARDEAKLWRRAGADRERTPDVWGGRGWGNRPRASALAASLGVIAGAVAGVTGGCASSDCMGGCDGGTVYPAVREDEPVRDVETVEWAFEFEGDHYEITCTTGPEYGAHVSIGHGDQILCESTLVHISRDVGPMRIQARDLEGRWSTDGWYDVVPDGGPDCGCTLFEVVVPIAYRQENP